MMIGEFEFEGIFTEDHNSFRDPFPVYSSILFIVFVLVMSIIIMNLLVGLAVDDIKEIQENAELEKLSMHVRKYNSGMNNYEIYYCTGEVSPRAGEILS